MSAKRIGLILLCSLLSLSFETLANDSHWRFAQTLTLPSIKVHVWIQNYKRDPAPILESLKKNMSVIADHKVFSGRLPTEVAILIDGEWTKTGGYWSNQLTDPNGVKAVLFNPESILSGSDNLRMLVHELMHLAHYAIDPNEEGWIREGIPLMAEYLVTGSLNPFFEDGFREPSTSLLATHDPNGHNYDTIESEAAQYGHILQFFNYSFQLCGKLKFFEKFLESGLKKKGIDLFEVALKSSNRKICSSFEETFRAFSIARFYNDPLYRERYVGLTRTNAKLEKSAAFELPPYSAGAYKRSSKEKQCRKDEVPWGELRCIRIRLN